jgi:hypothetical protein
MGQDARLLAGCLPPRAHLDVSLGVMELLCPARGSTGAIRWPLAVHGSAIQSIQYYMTLCCCVGCVSSRR